MTEQDILNIFNEDQNPEDEKKRAFKAFFLTPEGEKALEYLLLDLKFIGPCENEGDMALCNYAKDLVCMIYGDKIKRRGLIYLVKKLFARKKGLENG